MNKDMLMKRVLSYSSPLPKGCLLKAPQFGPLGLGCALKVQLSLFKNIPPARPPNNSNEVSPS